MPYDDSTSFARRTLENYARRIALNDHHGLRFMTVGPQRMELIASLKRNMDEALQLGRPQPPRGGAFFDVGLGDYGSGKTQSGYWLGHDALCAKQEVLVAHCQITGDATFPAMLATALRGVRLSRVDSVVMQDIETSAYGKVAQWAGGGERELIELIRSVLRNVPEVAAVELAAALRALARPKPDAAPMQMFLSRWVQGSEPRMALAVFESFFRLFHRVQVRRLCLIVDEFEALSAASEQQLKEFLQFLQALHDDFAGCRLELPALYMVFFSTDDFWQMAAAKLPSLLRAGDRVRRTTAIPNVSRLEIVALMERYITLYILSEEVRGSVDYESFLRACDECWAELAGKAHHMRSVHATVRSKVEQLLFPSRPY